jgi:glucose-1-phosphatase
VVPIEAILFDLGGVLIELSGPMPVVPGIPASSEELKRRWLLSPAVRQYESGEIDTQTFSHAFVNELGIDITPEAFLHAFEQWPTGPYKGAVELLRKLQDRFQLGCLSNTNELHWHKFGHESVLLDCFHVNLPSHQTGFVKPDPEVYINALEVLACDPGRVLFLDDNLVNVEAAVKLGLHSELTNTPVGAAQVLANYGLLDLTDRR